MQRRDRREHQAPGLAPGQKLPHGPSVRRPRAPVGDPRGEELQKPRHRHGPRVDDQPRQHDAGSSAACAMSGGSARCARAGRLSRLDERLELLVVVRQRLGEREEPPDGVLRAAEAHLDPAGLDRHACGQAGQARLERLAGHRDPDRSR